MKYKQRFKDMPIDDAWIHSQKREFFIKEISDLAFGENTIERGYSMEEVIEEANRLDYGLAAYAYTKSAKTAQELGAGIESGQVSINHHGLGLVDTPFGGVKDSGYGSEGGPEGLDAYMTVKLVSQTGL